MDIPTFKSRAEAFDYMFTTLCTQGEDMMEAAKKAETFAEIICKNRALPNVPKNFVGQCVDFMKQMSEFKRDYPDMWDVASGVLGGVVGLFAGTKAAESQAAEEDPAEPLDFDNMKEA